MASIDIITTASFAYKKTWDERAYLFPMVVLPLLIKFFFYNLAEIFVDGDNILRFSIFMLPAYFAEGWLLSHWARTIMLGHRWPFKPTGNDEEDNKKLSERARGVLGGAVAFTLINILMGGYFHLFTSFIPLDMNPQEAEPSVAIMGVLMMISTFLLFRYIWFYIPLSANISPRYFFEKVKPLRVTYQMIGIWLVCFIPAVVALQLFGGVLSGMMVEGQSHPIIVNLLNFLHITLDTIKNLICTAGIAYAVLVLLKGKSA